MLSLYWLFNVTFINLVGSVELKCPFRIQNSRGCKSPLTALQNITSKAREESPTKVRVGAELCVCVSVSVCVGVCGQFAAVMV